MSYTIPVCSQHPVPLVKVVDSAGRVAGFRCPVCVALAALREAPDA